METFGEKISAEACSGKEIAGLLKKMIFFIEIIFALVHMQLLYTKFSCVLFLFILTLLSSCSRTEGAQLWPKDRTNLHKPCAMLWK